MPTLEDSGTKTADGTEQTLTTLDTNGVFILEVDTGAMTNGNTLELKIYTKVLTGGTSRLAYVATYSNVQATPNKYSVPVHSGIEFIATLKQLAATYRDYPWAVYSI